MPSSEKLSKATSRGLLSQLSQARLLFQELRKTSGSEEKNPTAVKQILLHKITPFIENQQIIPGLSTALHTVLKQVSDKDIINFLLELENILAETLDEIQAENLFTPDLDMRDKHLQISALENEVQHNQYER